MRKYYEAISSIIKPNEYLKSSKDEYKIKELISNGVNKIYLAENSKGEKVAIKQFYFNNKDFLNLQYWLYENIEHNFIDKPIDMFEIKSYHFQVKSFYENYVSLEKFASNKVPMKIKKNIMLSIADFIKYLHSKNIAHTDLKPEQFILVDKKIKLLDFDFGVTDKFYFPGGTKEWFSPEHITHKKITTKTDIFTLGLMFHWFLTQKHPFEDYFEKGFEEAIVNGKYKLSIYENIFSKMLNISPEDRIEIDEFIDFFHIPNKIYLMMNNKKYLIIKDEIITREMCKRFFKNHKEIAPKHFALLKKADGWVVKGFKDERFNDVYVDGEIATNKEISVTDGSIIKIGNTEFKIVF
jgi:serine/threonine protein kinase